MAQNRTPFSTQLEDIANPQDYSKAGQHILQAGELEGQAKVLAEQAREIPEAFLFKQARGAVQGYGEAEIATKTAEAVSRFEDSPALLKSKGAATAIEEFDRQQGAKGTVEEMGMRGQAEDPVVGQVRAEAARFYTAQSQGLLTQDEVITRIGDVVKKWSGRLPGMASEFRVAAFNEVGISNIDIYSIHKALTTESEGTKAALRAQKMHEDYIKEVAQYHGKHPAMVTQQDMQYYFAYKQLEGVKTNMENESKVRAVNQEQKGLALDKLISTNNAQNLVQLSSLFHDWDQANDDPKMTAERDAISVRINKAITDMRLQNGAYINKQGGLLGLTGADTEKRWKFQNEQHDALEKVLKTKEGFDTMRQIIGRNKDTAEDMANSFKIHFPALVAWGSIGVAPEIWKVSVTPGGDELLKTVLGPAGAAEFKGLGDKVASWASRWKRTLDPKTVDKYGPLDLRNGEGAAREPEEKRTDMHAIEGDVILLSRKKTLSPEEKVTFANQLHALTTNAALTDAESFKRFTHIMDMDTVQQKMMEIPAEKRQAIAAPVFNTFALTVRSAAAELPNLLNEYNNDAGNMNAKINLTYDGYGRVVIQKDPAPTADVTMAETPAGGVTGVAMGETPWGGTRGAVSESSSARLTEKRIEAKLKLVNGGMKALNYAHTLAETGQNRYELGQSLVDNINGDGLMPPPLTPGEKIAAEKREEVFQAREPSAQPDYQTLRESTIPKNEGGVKHELYDDGTGKGGGKNTIGIGFNILQDNAKAIIVEALGVSDKEATDIMGGRRKMETSEAWKLYHFMINDAEKQVNTKLKGVELKPEMRVAIVDLVYNGGTNLLGKDMVAFLRAGDFQGAVDELLYASGTQTNPNLAKRRYESALLMKKAVPTVKVPAWSVYKKNVETNRTNNVMGVRG